MAHNVAGSSVPFNTFELLHAPMPTGGSQGVPYEPLAVVKRAAPGSSTSHQFPRYAVTDTDSTGSAAG